MQRVLLRERGVRYRIFILGSGGWACIIGEVQDLFSSSLCRG